MINLCLVLSLEPKQSTGRVWSRGLCMGDSSGGRRRPSVLVVSWQGNDVLCSVSDPGDSWLSEHVSPMATCNLRLDVKEVNVALSYISLSSFNLSGCITAQPAYVMTCPQMTQFACSLPHI